MTVPSASDVTQEVDTGDMADVARMHPPAQPGTITHIMHIERLIQRLPASFSLCPRNIDP